MFRSRLSSMLIRMKIGYLLLLCFLVLQVWAQDVYMTVDENGNPTFTDQPVEGSEKIEVRDVTTIPAPRNVPPPRRSSEPVEIYSHMAVINPKQDETYFRSEGDLQISVSISPQLRSSDSIVYYLDGQSVHTGKTTSLSIAEMDRGTHSVRVAVVNSNGDELKSSQTVTFHLRQASVLSR